MIARMIRDLLFAILIGCAVFVVLTLTDMS